MMCDMSKVDRRSRSLTEQLEATLSERIRQGTYKPSCRLPSEAEIAAERRVSRTVVREAISRVPFFGEKPRAQVIVIMPDGRKSPARTVDIAAASAPGIFTPGVLNQDNTVNTALNGAPGGTVIQVYCTGLLTANVTARLGVETITAPRYAGPAPGLLGLQQVNLDVPGSITANSVDLFICSGAICSPSVRVYIKPAP